MKDHHHINQLLHHVSMLDDTDQWNALARQGLREDLYTATRNLCLAITTTTDEPSPDHAIHQWEQANQARLDRARTTLHAVNTTTPHTLTTLSVAVRQIQHGVTHAAPSP